MKPETIEIVTPRTTFRVEGRIECGVARLLFQSDGGHCVQVDLTPGEMERLVGGLRRMQQHLWSHNDG